MTTTISTPKRITPPPSPAPQRGDEDTFADRMDARLTWENEHLYPELDVVITEINDRAIICANAADVAAVVPSFANFKGRWSDLTGALPKPASVYENGNYWTLLDDLADVTTATPGVSASWSLAKTLNALPWLTASSDAVPGQVAAIKSDGTVAVPVVVNAALGTAVDVHASAFYAQVEYDIVNNKIVVVYNNGANVAIRSATFVSGAWTWQTEYKITTANSYANHKLIRCGSTGKMAVMWVGQSAPYKRYVNIFDCSGSTPVTSGSIEWYATQTTGEGFVFDETTAQICMSIYQTADNVVKVGLATLSGNSTVTPIFSTISLTAGTPSPHLLAVDGKLVCTSPNAAGNAIIAYVGTISGTAVTCNTPITLTVAFTAGSEYFLSYDQNAKKILLLQAQGALRVAIGTLSGGAINFESASYQIQSTAARKIWMSYDIVAKGTTIIFEDVANSYYVSTITLKFLNGSLMQSAKTIVRSADNGGATVSVACSPNGDNFFTYAQNKIVNYKNYSTTAGNYIGIFQSAVTSGQAAKVAISQYVDENQTGLTVGKKYYVADNGTLTTTETATFAGTAISATKLIVKG